MNKRFFAKLLGISSIFLGSCSSQVAPPQPYGPLPTKEQLDWHYMEYFSLICYGLNTYTEQEWAYGDVDPKLFDPSNLDTDQWAKVASEAGMKGLILVAKHHDGFCLWPSKFTDYSVKATPWKNGKGDVLGDLSESCKKYGLKLGVYLSPWDRNHAEYGRPEYVKYYYRQLEELMTEYGDVFEFWIDGANGGTGYYGGTNDTRSIDRRHYYGYDSIFAIVKKHQPRAVIFSDVGPGVRWVGNESGIAGETNWNTIDTNGMFPGESSPDFHRKLGTGEAGGKEWIPAEANTTLLWPKAWYYHTGHQPRSLKNLMDLYYTSIGRGAPLNLGLAIDPEGQIREMDVDALLSFKKQRDLEFSENKVGAAKIVASDHRGNSPEYSPLKTIDDETMNTYWATNDGVQNASITFSWDKPVEVNRLVLQEHIALGQRVQEFEVQIKESNGYKKIVEGTTIGYKRALRFDKVKTDDLRIVFKTGAPCLTISNIGLFLAPSLLSDPVYKFDLAGNLTFERDDVDKVRVFYALGDSPKATEFVMYTGPIALPLGGTVSFYAMDTESKSRTDMMTEKFSIPKSDWKVYANGKWQKNIGKHMIDGDRKTWYTLKDGQVNRELAVDMGKILSIESFGYLPRQDGQRSGVVQQYEFYVSQDGLEWNAPVSSGFFDNIGNNPVRQVKYFQNGPHKARYVKLVAKSTLEKDSTVSIAELDVFHKGPQE